MEIPLNCEIMIEDNWQAVRTWSPWGLIMISVCWELRDNDHADRTHFVSLHHKPRGFIITVLLSFCFTLFDKAWSSAWCSLMFRDMSQCTLFALRKLKHGFWIGKFQKSFDPRIVYMKQSVRSILTSDNVIFMNPLKPREAFVYLRPVSGLNFLCNVDHFAFARGPRRGRYIPHSSHKNR